MKNLELIAIVASIVLLGAYVLYGLIRAQQTQRRKQGRESRVKSQEARVERQEARVERQESRGESRCADADGIVFRTVGLGGKQLDRRSSYI